VRVAASAILKPDTHQLSSNQEMLASNWDTTPAAGLQNDIPLRPESPTRGKPVAKRDEGFHPLDPRVEGPREWGG
jgi:hypothetical protein